MQSSQEALRNLGAVTLFLGTDTFTWDLPHFQQAASFAHRHAIATLLVKVADGSVAWYGGLGTVQAIQATMQQEDVNLLPYLYLYGDHFQGLEDELKLLTGYLDTFGTLCLHLGPQWAGQRGWAQTLLQHLQDHDGTLLVVCPPDPETGNLGEVLQTLAPVVSLWLPQIQSHADQQGWHQQFSALALDGFCLSYPLCPEQDEDSTLEDWLQASYRLSPQISLWDYASAIAHENRLSALRESLAAWEKSRRQEEDDVIIELETPIIQEHFEAVEGGWQLKNTLDANGEAILLRGAILEHYRSNGCKPYAGYSSVGLPMTNELPLERFGSQYARLAQQGMVIVFFERGVWIYDPQHLVDAPYGAGEVYPLKLYDNGLGRDPSINKLNADIATLQQQLVLVQQNNTPLAVLQQIKALLVPVL